MTSPRETQAAKAGQAPVPGCLSVLIPAFDEVDLLPATLARVLAAPAFGWAKEIVIVDDGSTDGTRDYLQRIQMTWRSELRDAAMRLGRPLAPDATVNATLRTFFHPRNRGKGAAVRTAIAAASGDVCLIQDADLEYDPLDYERLLGPILSGQADVVYGSRFLGLGARRILYFRHAIANGLLTTISNVLTDLNLTDVETGYKVFRTELLKSVYLVSDRFGFEPEVTAKIAKLGARVYEVPVSYHGRTYDEGKKITWRDALAAVWHIVRFNVLPGAYCHDAGHETLRNLGAIRHFNRYMYDTIAPYLGKRVVEVGSGIGNLTTFISKGRHVFATELEPAYLRTLRERFRDRVGVNVGSWDITQPIETGGSPRAQIPAGFDSVVCLNVLEHVEDHRKALENMRDVLRPGGALVVLVPAHPQLFCALDTEVGHWRRYTRNQLASLLQESGLTVDHLFPFNTWGLIGWYVNGVLLRRQRLPGEQLSLFGTLAPILTWIERRARPPIGLSYIAIARRA